ncbi:MAG: gliding motility-associated C-terminal domain-containing protein, partial [Bacteroidales bacterium]|nr:gliding motility-associated C-terminal domain-containing protein [Bacteroidales bacterium]
PNIRAYNENDGIFIFNGGTSIPELLYSIDINKGVTIANPPYTKGGQYTYDNKTGTLYALIFEKSQSVYYLSKINPYTGETLNISNNYIPNIGICQGFYTFDEINHRFIILSNKEIYTIDASSGVLISNPSLELLTNELIVCASLCFDNSKNKLYGLLWDPMVTKKYFLVSIDPSTGAISKIGTGSSIFEQGGSSAIDKANQQFLYLYSSVNQNGYVIATFDIKTGNVLYNKIIKHFNSTDNFFSLIYDNKREKLLSIHWLSKIDNNIYLGNDTTICPNDNLILETGNPNLNYLWNTGATSNSIIVSKAGEYSVTLSYGSCNKTGSINISNYPASVLDLGKDTTICGGCSIILNAGNIFNYYKWQDGSDNPTYTVNKSGTYWVEAIDENDCKYTDKINIKNECDGKDIFIPNAFIPNNKSINNVFKVVGTSCITSFNIKIFNRWGILVFETNDINFEWDGKFKNTELPQGIYAFIITYCNNNINNTKQKKIGNITLLR